MAYSIPRYVASASYGSHWIPVSTLHISNWSDFEAMISAGMVGITGTAWLGTKPSGVKRSRIGAVPKLWRLGNAPL
jgi:hypothetical protein